MWEGKDIAIKSTYQKYCESAYDPRHIVWTGKVDYYEPEKAVVIYQHGAHPFLYKDRECYEHEKELRGVVIFEPIFDHQIWARGLYIKFDLLKLIDEVVISSKATRADRKNVEGSLQSFGFNKSVRLSSIG